MRTDLKFLNRKELIEIIYQLKKSEQELQTENEYLRKQLDSKRIALSKAGSIAEASIALTNLFSAAQTTADTYLAEIEARRADIERDYTALIEDAQKKAEDIIGKAMMRRDAIVAEANKAHALLRLYESAIEKKKIELSSCGIRER